VNSFLAQFTGRCDDTAQLLSESMDRTLPYWTRVQLQMHLVICKGCRQYRKQLWTIREALRRAATTLHEQAGEDLLRPSSESQAQIKQALARRRL
jgi:predicted anti-sigma-YlaC factor YlaD